MVVFARVFGKDTVFRNQHTYLMANPAQRAAGLSQAARQARAEAELLRTLTTDEAVKRIEQTRAEQAAWEAQRAEQEYARLHDFGAEEPKAGPKQDSFRGL